MSGHSTAIPERWYLPAGLIDPLRRPGLSTAERVDRKPRHLGCIREASMTHQHQVGDVSAPAAVSDVGEPVREAADRPPQSAPGRALVGRQAELDTLQSFLSEAATRGGTLL